MGFINFGKSKKQAGTPLREMKRFHGKRLKQAVLRNGNDEKILGRAGGITVTDSEIILLCDAHEVFRCRTEGATMAELMSLDGVDIRGIDSATGERVHAIAYYEYYKK